MSSHAKDTSRNSVPSRGLADKNPKMIEQRARAFEAKLHELGFKQENAPADDLRRQAFDMFEQLGR